MGMKIELDLYKQKTFSYQKYTHQYFTLQAFLCSSTFIRIIRNEWLLDSFLMWLWFFCFTADWVSTKAELSSWELFLFLLKRPFNGNRSWVLKKSTGSRENGKIVAIKETMTRQGEVMSHCHNHFGMTDSFFFFFLFELDLLIRRLLLKMPFCIQ